MSRFYRNPFVWAFVIGIVSLTLIRPLLRREPAPPPVLGPMPAYSLTTTDGRRLDGAELRGSVYIAGFVSARCTSDCPRVARSMARLGALLDERPLDGLRVVGIDLDADDADAARRLAQTLGLEHAGKLVLVDPGGSIRGYYGTDDSGLDEVYHRARRILAEAGGRR